MNRFPTTPTDPPDSATPSVHPPHPDGPFFTEKDLVWRGSLIAGVAEYALLGVCGGQVDLPMALFRAEDRVDLYRDPIPVDEQSDWWLLAAVHFTGLEPDMLAVGIDLFYGARQLLAELCKERPSDLLAAGHDPADLPGLIDRIVDNRWQSIRRYLKLDPRRAWALSSRNAAWLTDRPPEGPSPRERFERLLLAELIGQVLEERNVMGLTQEAEQVAASAIADAAMKIWRSFRNVPANRKALNLRRFGAMVSLHPALMHLQGMEDDREWLDAPVPAGQAETPLMDLLSLGLKAGDLHAPSEDRAVVVGMRSRITNAMMTADAIAYKPPEPDLYFECFGICERRYEHLMAKAAAV